MLVTAPMRGMQSTVAILVSAVSSVTVDINLFALANATSGTQAVREAMSASDAALVSPESDGKIRDLLFAKYEPLSILVGVSLVSAHLVADAQASKTERMSHLRSRGRRRSGDRRSQ